MSMRRWKMCSRVFGAAVALALSLSGRPVSAQMDDVTMPGGEKAGTPVESKALLSESEFNEWAAKPGAVVFDLHYRGLAEKESDLAYNFRGYGTHRPQETSFTQSVGLPKRRAAQFSLPLLKGSEEGVVEFEPKTIRTLYLGKRKIKALYLDLDCDGKLGPGERMEPAKVSAKFSEFDFVTPDFSITQADGKKVPYRLIAWVESGKRLPFVTVSPYCFWEGKARMGDTETSLRLLDQSRNGSFLDYGQDGFQMIPPSTDNSGRNRVQSQTLSGLIRLENVFYRLLFTGEGTKEKPLRAVLCKDTTPTGKIQIKPVLGRDAELERGQLVSAENPTIRFSLPSPIQEFPEGRYRVEAGQIVFGKKDESGKLVLGNKDTGLATFTQGPECRIVGGQTTTVELGRPEIRVVAVEQSKRNANPVEFKTSFPCGTDVLLDVKLMGKQGEEYGSPWELAKPRKSPEPPKFRPLPVPHVQILGPDGKEVVSGDLEYG